MIVLLTVVVTILLAALVAAISFWAGARYCARNMLPGIMARKTSKELDDLADAVDAERQALGFADTD